MERPPRELLHMLTACLWAKRSMDPRAQVGAVITTLDLRRVLSFGYNGVAKGVPEHYIRKTPGDSGCLHAEMNAIAFVDSTIGNKVMFCTHSPCEICAQLIMNANIYAFHYLHEYRDKTGRELMEYAGIRVHRFTLSEEELWKEVGR